MELTDGWRWGHPYIFRVFIMMTIGRSRRVRDMSLLKEKFLEPVQNASHNIVDAVFRLLRVNHRSEVDPEAIAAYRDDLEAWESISDEALETFEKQFE